MTDRDDWRTGDLAPLERFTLGRIRGATDRWPDATPEPDRERDHGAYIPDDMPGPYGPLEDDEGGR